MTELIRTQEAACEGCGATIAVTTDSLNHELYKKPDTYWFDGSAEEAGVTYRFFVQCPECRQLAFVADKSIPIETRQFVINRNLRGIPMDDDRGEC